MCERYFATIRENVAKQILKLYELEKFVLEAGFRKLFKELLIQSWFQAASRIPW